jgi:hypothetical protein
MVPLKLTGAVRAGAEVSAGAARDQVSAEKNRLPGHARAKFRKPQGAVRPQGDAGGSGVFEVNRRRRVIGDGSAGADAADGVA